MPPKQNFNSKVADAITGLSVDLSRVEPTVVGGVVKLLDDLGEDLENKIRKYDIEGVSSTAHKRRRAETLIDQSRKTISSSYKGIDKKLDKELLELSDIAAEATVNTLNDVMQVETPIFSTAMSRKDLQTLVNNQVVLGGPASEWWNKQSLDTQQRFAQQIRIGVAAGENNDSLVRRIVGEKGLGGIMPISKREAAALARTSVQNINNTVMNEVYEENKDVLRGRQALATLDGRTTPICIARSGASWDFDGNPLPESPKQIPFPGPPPWHFNCRTVLQPLTKSWEQLIEENTGKKMEVYEGVPSNVRASMDGEVPAGDMTYDSWLKTKPVSFQKSVLGPNRYDLWKNGDIDLSQLVNQAGRPLTLPELRELRGGEFGPIQVFEGYSLKKYSGSTASKYKQYLGVIVDGQARGTIWLPKDSEVWWAKPVGGKPEAVGTQEEAAKRVLLVGGIKPPVVKPPPIINPPPPPPPPPPVVVPPPPPPPVAPPPPAKPLTPSEALSATHQKLLSVKSATHAFPVYDTSTVSLERVKGRIDDSIWAQLPKSITGVEVRPDQLRLVHYQGEMYLADDQAKFDKLKAGGYRPFSRVIDADRKAQKTGATVLQEIQEAVKEAADEIRAAAAGKKVFSPAGPQVTVESLLDELPKLSGEVPLAGKDAQTVANQVAAAFDYDVKKKLRDKIHAILQVDAEEQSQILLAYPQSTIGKNQVFKEKLKEAKDFLQQTVVKSPHHSYAGSLAVKPTEIKVETLKGSRAFHRTGSIHVKATTETKVMVHEMVHGLDYYHQGRNEHNLKFLESRTKGESWQSLKKLTGINYSASEKAKPDKFINAYMGKDYSGTASEIGTMGYEQIFQDPLSLYLQDRQYFEHIVNNMRGQYHLEATGKVQPVATVAPPKPKVVPLTKPGEIPKQYEVIKSLPGSTGPKLVADPHGAKWVAKISESPGFNERLTNEVDADKVYQALGIAAPKSGLQTVDGKLIKFSEFIEGGQTLQDFEKTATPAQIKAVKDQLKKNFATDALLANWDVVGMTKDNILVKDGVAYRIDNGGALRYRAQGALKGDKFGPIVGELESLLDASRNPSTANIFKGITDEEIKAQVKELIAKRSAIQGAITDAETRGIINKRLDYLEDKYLKAKPVPPAPPPPAKIQPGLKHAERFVDNTVSETALRDWREGLTEAQRRAISGWGGIDYRRINAVMRGAKGDTATLKQIEEIRKAISKAPKPQGTLWRGMGLKKELLEQWSKPGHEVEFPTFQSWTKDLRTARDHFARSQGADEIPVVLEVRNTKAGDISVATGLGEAEALMPDKVRMRVVEQRTLPKIDISFAELSQAQHLEVLDLPTTEVRGVKSIDKEAAIKLAQEKLKLPEIRSSAARYFYERLEHMANHRPSELRIVKEVKFIVMEEID